MHQTHEPGASSGGGPFQHLLVAVGIPKRENRTFSDETVDAHRFSRSIIDELNLAFLYEHRLIIGLHLVAHDTGGTDYLLGWNAVDTLGENSHKFHAPA